jgi:hypothetical protein
MNTPKRITVTLEVANDAEARELNDAWEEIVTGKKLVRTEALSHGVESIMERARVALETIETGIRRNPTPSIASLTRVPSRTTNGIHSVQPLAISVRVSVCT